MNDALDAGTRANKLLAIGHVAVHHFDAERRDFRKTGGLDASNVCLELLVAPPLLDDRARSGLHTHGVGRQQIGDDFKAAGIADLDERIAGRHDAFTFAQASQDDAVDRRRHRNDPATGIRSWRCEPGLRALQLGGCGAHREDRSVHGFLGRLRLRLARIDLLCGHDRALCQLAHARQVALQLRERGACPLLLRPRSSDRRSRALEGRLGFGARSLIEKRRRLRANARHHRSAPHDVARFELDAQYTSGDRR